MKGQEGSNRSRPGRYQLERQHACGNKLFYSPTFKTVVCFECNEVVKRGVTHTEVEFFKKRTYDEVVGTPERESRSPVNW